MLFVFTALLEFAVVNILSRHETRKPQRPTPPLEEPDPEIAITSGDATEEEVGVDIFCISVSIPRLFKINISPVICIDLVFTGSETPNITEGFTSTATPPKGRRV